MATFPTTGLLDSFAGADETPIATNWSGPIFSGIGELRRLSNALAPNATVFGGSYYDIASFGPDSEVYATIAVLDGGGVFTGFLYCRAQSVGTTSLDGYIAYFYDSTGAGELRMAREDNGSDTDLATYTPPDPIAVGDKYGLRCLGTTIELWYAPVSTGSWSMVASAVDATYNLSGRLGVALDSAAPATRLDDFGGGTYVAPSVTDNSRFVMTLGVG